MHVLGLEPGVLERALAKDGEGVNSPRLLFPSILEAARVRGGGLGSSGAARGSSSSSSSKRHHHGDASSSRAASSARPSSSARTSTPPSPYLAKPLGYGDVKLSSSRRRRGESARGSQGERWRSPGRSASTSPYFEPLGASPTDRAEALAKLRARLLGEKTGSGKKKEGGGGGALDLTPPNARGGGGGGGGGGSGGECQKNQNDQSGVDGGTPGSERVRALFAKTLDGKVLTLAEKGALTRAVEKQRAERLGGAAAGASASPFTPADDVAGGGGQKYPCWTPSTGSAGSQLAAYAAPANTPATFPALVTPDGFGGFTPARRGARATPTPPPPPPTPRNALERAARARDRGQALTAGQEAALSALDALRKGKFLTERQKEVLRRARMDDDDVVFGVGGAETTTTTTTAAAAGKGASPAEKAPGGLGGA
jgi:hypothetical protein